MAAPPRHTSLRQSLPLRPWQLLLALSLLYASCSSILYLFELSARHRVESAWIVFGFLFVPTALARWSFGSEGPRADVDRRVLGGMLLAAAAFYLPSLTVGMFADDYVLRAATDGWDLVPAAWEHFRPLPLAVWALLGSLGASAPVFHAVNVALHGLNGYLTYRLTRELGESAEVALVVAALWLVFPGSVEAVTWLSGLHDVLMVTLVMSFLIAASRGQSAVAIVCLVLATFSKETAVCTPVLLLLLRFRRRIATPLIVTAFAWCLLFGLARLAFKPTDGLFEPLTGFLAKNLLASLYGSLAMPWTREQMFAYPWLLSTLVIATAMVFSLAIARLSDRAMWTNAAIGCAWALAAALPLYRFFYVAPDLLGSRYLYLPAVGWSLAIVSTALRHPNLTGRIAIAVLVCAGGMGTVVQQHRWRAAAEYRDAVLARAQARSEEAGCRNPEFRSGPDALAGVMVFRNGLNEAAARIGIREAGPLSDCIFEWDADDFVARAP